LLDSRFLTRRNKLPLLGNDSVNTIPRQRMCMQERNGVFDVVRAEMLQTRDKVRAQSAI
jgi:hypothetical protein